MSENKQFVVQNDGRQIITDDLNLLGETGALSGDRVYASLLQMTPGDGSSVTKAVWTHAHATSANAALVSSSGTVNGSIKVRPFRAFVSSRTSPSTEARKAYRDIRSAISVAEGATALDTTVALGSLGDASNPRWCLVYAAVSIDASTPSVTRKIKDPTTKAISATSIVSSTWSTMTIGAVAGTAAASPVWPSTPADSGTTYYVPLAYVRLPAAFGAGSTVAKTDIAEVAPCLPISRATGAASVRTAEGANALTTAQQQAWGSSGTRPDHFLPKTMFGGESLLLAVKVKSGANSHANNAVVDSGDWRGRLCTWTANVTSDTNGFAWNGTSNGAPQSTYTIDPTFNGIAHGMGQSFAFTANKATVCSFTGEEIAGMGGTGSGGTNTFALYVDNSDGGKLKVTYTATNDWLVVVRLDFSGTFANA